MSATPTSAVFLSYASQDAAAARCLCEALRAAGIEVWFDQSELVGGDAWDAKIRKQIGMCALFVPILSANTQAREEGYFRLEWKLAAQRTHMMTEEKAFVLPVVIDGTRDADAKVPAEFRAVQWTRVPAGESSAAFVNRVKVLLGGKQPEVSQVFDPPTPAARAPSAGHKPGRPPNRRSPNARRMSAGLATIALGIVAYFAFRPVSSPLGAGAETRLHNAEKPSAVSPVPVVPPLATDKSIAVLPFDNLSTDRENGFFADGVHHDVLTALQNIRELRVLSRTTMMQYRERDQKSLPQIARELGVAYILEGSVRRAGNKVRVSAQLIDARTDTHLWALPAGERELTDIFAVQAQLASAIATELKATLSPQEKTLIERRPTANTAAYDLLLKARQSFRLLFNDAPGRAALDEQESLLRMAVDLDPQFSTAWAELAVRHAWLYALNYDFTDTRRLKAKQAIDAALRLAPDSPDVVRGFGDYLTMVQRDYPAAIAQFEKLAAARPNDPEVAASLGNVLMRAGRWAEAHAAVRKAFAIDTGNGFFAQLFYWLSFEGRRFDDAREAARRSARLDPEGLLAEFNVGFTEFVATGSMREADAFVANLTPAQADSAAGVAIRKWWAIESGRYAEAVRLERAHPTPETQFQEHWAVLVGTACAAAALGDQAAAREIVAPCHAFSRAKLAREPDNKDMLRILSVVEALLGNAPEALRHARRAIQLSPAAFDATEHGMATNRLALIHAWIGEKDQALAEVTRMIRQPFSQVTVHMMRHDPYWFPLRGDPRFEALLNDPKNNAPLF